MYYVSDNFLAYAVCKLIIQNNSLAGQSLWNYYEVNATEAH